MKRIVLALIGIVLSFAANAQTASRNFDFLNIISVVGQLESNITVYLNANGSATDATYIGARHWREGLGATQSQQTAVLSALAARGIDFVAYPPNTGGAGFQTLTTAAMITALHQWQGIGSLFAIEGPNEPINFGITYQGVNGGAGQPFTSVAAFERDYYTALKADAALAPIIKITATEVGAETPNVGLQFAQIPTGGGTTFPDGTHYADGLNYHLYTVFGGTAQTIDPTLGDQLHVQLISDFVTTFANGYTGYTFAQATALPRYVTEFGYHTGAGPGPAVDVNTQGKNILTALLNFFQEGYKLVSIYELYDEGDGFGIFSTTGTPRVSATWLHNLITVLADTGGAASSFNPGSLAYTTTNLPSTGKTMLLQRSTDGAFAIPVWNNVTNFNLNTQTPITINPTTVSVNVPTAGSLFVFDPLQGTTAIAAASNATSINVALKDAPQVVIFVPGAAAAGTVIPSGPLHVVGNQLQSGAGVNVRLSCSNYANPTANVGADMNTMRNQGFNCARVPWYDKVTCPSGVCNFAAFDAIIAAATANSMRVVFDHHANEGANGSGSCLSRQANGLWYDVNGAAPWNSANGTDGCGTAGTVTYVQFKANWQSFATHYANNATVIGFDLHHEPIGNGGSVGGTTTAAVPLGLYAQTPGISGAGADPSQWNEFQPAMGVVPKLFDQYYDQSKPPDDAFGWSAQAAFWASTASQDPHTAASSGVTAVWGFPLGCSTCGNIFPNIAAGQYDSQLQGIITGWKAQGYTNLYLRPAWEFNLPNNYGVSQANVTQFIAAWKHLYTVLHTAATAQGTQVHIVWNPAVGSSQVDSSLTVAQQFPTGFVDVIGMDAYGSNVDPGWAGPHDPLGNYSGDPTNFSWQLMFQMAIANNLPIALCEISSLDALFAQHAIQAFNQRNTAIQVAFVILYTNTVDFTNGSAPAALAQWKAGFGSPASAQVINTTGGGTTIPPTGVNWGSANGFDLKAMVNDVGASLVAIDSTKLIMVEGVVNNGNLFNGTVKGTGTYPSTYIPMDLSTVHTSPPSVSASNILFSIHDTPTGVSGSAPDSGTTKISMMNAAWGYLEIGNFAPVWAGLGASLDNTNGQLGDETAWSSTLSSYLNGQAATGPSFSGCQQPVGVNWLTFGNLSGQSPDGTLNPDGTNRTGQQSMYSGLLYTACGTTSTSWNPLDRSSGIALSVGNTVATTTATGGNSVRSTTSQSSGKYCFGVAGTTLTTAWSVGISNALRNNADTSGIGGTTNGIGISPRNGDGGASGSGHNQAIFYNAVLLSSGLNPSSNGDEIDICVDLTNKLLWATDTQMRVESHPWNNDTLPNQNPATGTGGLSFAGLTCPCFITFQDLDTGGVATINATGPFAVSTPTGFVSWQTPPPVGAGHPILISQP